MAATPPGDGAPPKQPEFIGPQAPDGPRAPEGPRTSTALPLSYAGIIAVLLVVAAIGGGLAVGTIARPTPKPRPTPTPRIATPTPQPTTDPAVFRQTLSSGCATEQGLWVVSNGGGLVRYNGKDWTQVDGTLRTLTQTSCDAGTLYAVGPVGAVLILDDRARQIQSFDVTLEDLRGIAAMPDGAMAVGSAGAVMLLNGGTWQPFARGLEEDLNAVVVFSLQSGWMVGTQGISYRLEVAGWRPVKTGVDVTLRGVAGPSAQTVVAVGDGGTILALSGLTWTKIDSGVGAPLRSIVMLGQTAWIVGDDGVVLTVDGALRVPGSEVPAKPPVVNRIDIGTTCSLTSAFVADNSIWIIGSRGGVSGIWKLNNGKIAERWGDC